MATQLLIRPLDEEGRSIRLIRAEVYVDVWGHGRMVALPKADKGVTLSLDRAWLCGSWPEVCKDPHVKARLILQVNGYVPKLSRDFLWLGGTDPGTRSVPSVAVDIQFPDAPPIRLYEGDSRELELRFRRPLTRVLRLVDLGGRRLSGVKVRAVAFLAHSNHCGAVEGEEYLFNGVTGASGEVTIPDADMEYAFEFYRPHLVLDRPEHSVYPMRLIAQLTGPLTTVVLRELERRPLHLEVSRGGQPAAALSVITCVAACPCGACCGQRGVTNAEGRLLLNDFFPEEHDRLELRDQSLDLIWKGNPADFPRSGKVIVSVP